MNEEKQKETELGNSMLAIIGGAAATFLTGLILYPLVEIAIDQFWDFDLFGEKKGITGNDIMLNSSIMIWFFIASLVGGFTCSLICRSYEYTHAIILIAIYLALLLFSLSSGKDKEDTPVMLISLIVVGAGFILGTRTGVRKKNAKKINKV